GEPGEHVPPVFGGWGPVLPQGADVLLRGGEVSLQIELVGWIFHPAFSTPIARSSRSWPRGRRRRAVTAPTRAKNMSHWVSQGSPWVPRKASAAWPARTADHHST